MALTTMFGELYKSTQFAPKFAHLRPKVDVISGEGYNPLPCPSPRRGGHPSLNPIPFE